MRRTHFHALVLSSCAFSLALDTCPPLILRLLEGPPHLLHVVFGIADKFDVMHL